MQKSTLLRRVKRLLVLTFSFEENFFLGAFFLLFRPYCTLSHGSFKVPKRWSRVHFYARFINGRYETEERELICRHLGEGDHVLELGACIGVVSCLIASKIKGGRQCSVEANPYLLPYLHENRQRNQADFEILAGALSDKSEIKFHLNKNIVGASSIRETGNTCSASGISPTSTEENYGPFNTLVADIEGGEYEFIQKHLSDFKDLKKIIVEFHPAILKEPLIKEAKSTLGKAGFERIDAIGDTEFWRKRGAD